MSKVREIQLKELELLKEFHDLCEKYGLTYYALGGTLLGAVRHKGFIPWDDDMDLGMPRKDYDIFIKKYHKELSNHVLLKKHSNNLGNTSIVDTKTKILFGKVECSPFIDIFPLDGFPKSKYRYFIHKNSILFYRMLSKLSVVNQMFERDRGKFENILIHIAKRLRTDKIINTDKVNSKLEDLIRKYPFESSPYVGNVLGSYRDKEIVLKEVFGKPVKLEFEDFEILGHQNPEDYLSNIYGDYMQMPKEEDRLGHFESTWGK